MIPYLQRRSRGSGYLTMAQEPALDGISKMYAFWFPITAKTTSSPLAVGWIKEKLTENWRSNSSLLPSKTWRKVRCSFLILTSALLGAHFCTHASDFPPPQRKVWGFDSSRFSCFASLWVLQLSWGYWAWAKGHFSSWHFESCVEMQFPSFFQNCHKNDRAHCCSKFYENCIKLH